MVQKHEEQAAMFAKRQDRFSQLLSKLLRDERQGEHVVTSSGLTDAEHEELERLAPEANQSARAELEAALDALRLHLASWDPLQVVAAVQFSKGWAPWGAYYEPTERGGEHYAELVGGLLSTHLPHAERAELTYEGVEALFAELEHIMEVVLLVNLSRRPGDGGMEEATLKFLGAMRWMMLRGDSYASHGIELARSLYEPHADWWVQRYGFSFDELMRVAEAAIELVQARVNALMQESATAGRSLVREYLREHASAGRPSTEEVSNLEAVAMFEIFIDHIGSAMSVTASELSAAFPDVPEETATRVLREFSVSLGTLPLSAYTGLFDVNPLRDRPFLEVDGRYIFVSPGLLRDPLDVLEPRLLAGQPGYPASRARTLDRLAVEYLGRMLPGARCFTHLFYENAELDGLVLFEDVAIVVEGKASSLSVQALRGDTVRLARDIRDAVEDAWTQGARARSFILGDGDSVFRDEDGNQVLAIPAGSITDVYIVNPTLHELGGQAPQLPRLRSLGLFPQDEFPWSVFINDLRVIAETCENAAVFLHYLVWRNRLPLGDRVMVGDELDLWGSYLLAERFGMLAGDGEVTIANSTTDFDAYYDGLAGRGPRQSAPRKFLEEPVRSFVDRMAQLRPQGWREAAGACLDLSIPELAVVSKLAPEVAREAAGSSAVSWRQIGRIALVALPPGTDAPSAADVASEMEDPTFVLYVTLAPKSKRRATVVWAANVRPVSFELSDFEQWAQEQRQAQMASAASA
jgi:hypothetical protein